MNSKVRKAIAGFEMLTGIFMLLNISYFLIDSSSSNAVPVTVHILFLLLYIGEAYAGRLLWEGKPWGHSLSIAAQSLHLITFDLPIVAYKFTGIAHFFLYYRSGETPGFEGTLGSVNYTFIFPNGSPPPMFGINVVALVLLVLLVRARKKKSHEKEQTNH